jgi:hypothetical protein
MNQWFDRKKLEVKIFVEVSCSLTLCLQLVMNSTRSLNQWLNVGAWLSKLCEGKKCRIVNRKVEMRTLSSRLMLGAILIISNSL